MIHGTNSYGEVGIIKRTGGEEGEAKRWIVILLVSYPTNIIIGLIMGFFFGDLISMLGVRSGMNVNTVLINS